MAIIFDKQLQVPFVYSHNNNIVEFYSDYGLFPQVSCELTITASGVTNPIVIKIKPNPQDKFKFNFKDVFSSLVSRGNFDDVIVPNVNGEFGYGSLQITKQDIIIDYRIEFSSGGFELLTQVGIDLILGVDDFEHIRKGNLNNVDNIVLTPYEGNNTRNYKINYWEGLPFDFSIYTQTDYDNINLSNSTSGQNKVISYTDFVKRIFSFDGAGNPLFDANYFTPNKVNVINVGYPPLINYTLNIKHSSDNCGEYFKFLNRQGGWSYFLFKKKREVRTTSSIGMSLQDFESANDTISTKIELGVSAKDSLTVFALKVEEYEKKIIEEMLISPKIYRLIKLDMVNGNEWVSERIASSEILIEDSQKVSYDIIIDLEKNDPKTIKLI